MDLEAWKMTRGDNIYLDEQDEVCHVIGTSRQNAPGASSWINFWEQCTNKRRPAICSICRTSTRDSVMVGAHVYIKQERVRKWNFIIPACSECNGDDTMDYNGPNTKWSKVKKSTIAVAVEAHKNTFE